MIFLVGFWDAEVRLPLFVVASIVASVAVWFANKAWPNRGSSEEVSRGPRKEHEID